MVWGTVVVHTDFCIKIQIADLTDYMLRTRIGICSSWAMPIIHRGMTPVRKCNTAVKISEEHSRASKQSTTASGKLRHCCRAVEATAYFCPCNAVFFNRGSASGCRRLRRNRPKLHGTKFATTVLCGCSCDHCIGLHEQCSHLRKVPRQKKLKNTDAVVWWTLLLKK